MLGWHEYFMEMSTGEALKGNEKIRMPRIVQMCELSKKLKVMSCEELRKVPQLMHGLWKDSHAKS
jgi:hypothetical protein